MKFTNGALPIRNGYDGPPLQSSTAAANSVQDYYAGFEGGGAMAPDELCKRRSEDNLHSEPCLGCPAANLPTKDEH
eukprot:261385-Pyramimonas_sp.AAC.1